MIDPGRLKTRLTILAPVETPDGQGGVARDYATQATVWAAVTPLSARGEVAADAAGAVVRVRITLRSNVELGLQHRLRDRGRDYRVVSIRAIEDGRFNEIDAEQRVE
ncbi:phage head closure protein [Rhodopseudomonas palustris]|uniref:Head-tail adaptor protein n=1 Tax=Rhodopseudomonas palustris (strain BisB18) TaxID=316056 RepID=Q217R3_RHOPB